MSDEHIQQLKQYITETLAHGYSKEHVVQLLHQSGWPQEYINAAFAAEQAAPLPPMPLPTHTASKLPPILSTPFAQSILLALGVGILNVVAFLLLIPSATNQIIDYITGLYAGRIISSIIIRILIITLSIAVIVALLLIFKFKRKAAAAGLLAVSLMAVFLSLIVEQNKIVGLKFSLGLLVAFPLSQAIWYYARRRVILQVVYGVAVIVLFILSARVLNTGRL